MDDRCSQCDELWRAYAKATTDHVQLLKEQENAASHSLARFEELEPQVVIAAGIRDRGRLAIKRHLAKNHAEHPRVMASGQSG
jgi:hypothetical protein